MLLNERWIYLGDPVSFEEAGVAIFRLHGGSWMLAAKSEALGPFDDGSILRAARVAVTPCIDGCELGPSQLGVRSLSCARRPLRRGRGWQEVAVSELPVGVTNYECSVVEPVRGCCTTFAAMPKMASTDDDRWKAHLERPAARGATLLATWNAHPEGSVIVAANGFDAGFTVVDFP
jgi:hypothetical protein